MASRFDLSKIESKELPASGLSSAFEALFQESLLLSLLHRDLIDQRQFDRCMEEIKDKDV